MFSFDHNVYRSYLKRVFVIKGSWSECVYETSKDAQSMVASCCWIEIKKKIYAPLAPIATFILLNLSSSPCNYIYPAHMCKG